VTAHPQVFEELRGQGLLLGLKLKAPVGVFVEAARAQGLLTVAAGENVVRILPPLNVSEAEVREGVAMLEKAAATLETQKEAAQ
jgi:acetylornithine/N-succinyldiaminopimelate aminotransferase